MQSIISDKIKYNETNLIIQFLFAILFLAYCLGTKGRIGGGSPSGGACDGAIGFARGFYVEAG